MNSAADYKVDANIFRLRPSGKEVTFNWPIAEVIAFNDVFIVRVDPEPDARFNENVYGIGPDGKVIWQIARQKHVYADSPYTKILAEDAGVVLFNWDGDELLVDPINGQILRTNQGK